MSTFKMCLIICLFKTKKLKLRELIYATITASNLALVAGYLEPLT
jgi:hypothetical protein